VKAVHPNTAATRLLRGVIPGRFRRPFARGLFLWRLARLSTNTATFRLLFTLLVRERRFPGVRTVRLRPLGGAEFAIRTDSSDANVVWDSLIGKYHRPPATVSADARLVIDLGANIGTTAADLANLFPQATVVAVELDPDTAEICRHNMRAWGPDPRHRSRRMA
jgi:hypothetical protein